MVWTCSLAGPGFNHRFTRTNQVPSKIPPRSWPLRALFPHTPASLSRYAPTAHWGGACPPRRQSPFHRSAARAGTPQRGLQRRDRPQALQGENTRARKDPASAGKGGTTAPASRLGSAQRNLLRAQQGGQEQQRNFTPTPAAPAPSASAVLAEEKRVPGFSPHVGLNYSSPPVTQCPPSHRGIG